MSALFDTRASAPLLVLLLLAAINLLAWPYSAAIQDGWFREGQPVEVLTVVFYLAATAWLLARAVARAENRVFNIHSALVLLLLAGREQDAHEWFTGGESPLKTRFFVDPQIATGDKLVGAVVAAVFIGLIVAYAWRYWRPLLDGVRRGGVAHTTAAFAAVLLPATKVVDALPRLLRDSGAALGDTLHRFVGINEEAVEMLLPLVMLLALWQSTRRPPDGGR
jgi:hypothetical protein